MEKTNQVACTKQNIALFNEMHGDPSSLANTLMPHLAGEQLEEESCIFDRLAAIDRERNVEVFAEGRSCTRLGRCAISGD